MARKLNDLLKMIIEKKGSDLHINPDTPPTMRLDGKLTPMDSQKLTDRESREICYQCLTEEQIQVLEQNRSIDLSFEVEGLSRFRANIFWSLDHIAGAFRTIPLRVPKPEELGLPEVAIDLTNRPRGLVLVTGPTGSGKSTTIASMISVINASRKEHIITIEDPIEYLHHQDQCVINQREIGRDAKSFPQALKYILRQDPNIVLIGEMRDLETIQSAITVAETGHLVLATLHTNTAAQTIDRIIDVFPPHQQNQVRTQLSFILEGVLSQQLLPKKGGGRALAMEILIPTPGIRNLIREGKIHQIYSQMQMGQQQTGMTTLDQSLAKLVKDRLIEEEEAMTRAADRNELKKLLS